MRGVQRLRSAKLVSERSTAAEYNMRIREEREISNKDNGALSI